MRIRLEVGITGNRLPKDKNRLFISMFKSILGSYDKDYLDKIYGNKRIKGFTFAPYMENCKFLKYEIELPKGRVFINISFYDISDGIVFYNAILASLGKKVKVKESIFQINNINLLKERSISKDKVVFKTMSPIIVKEHSGDNSKSWYHSLNDEVGQSLFLKKLKNKILDGLGNDCSEEVANIKVTFFSKYKEVKIKNYGIEVLGNLGSFEVEAKPFLLDYIYKSGVGSKSSLGFGMLDII